MDLCNRCLIIVNATSSVRARFTDRVEFCEYPTDPAALKEWAEGMLSQGGRIEVDNTTDRFRAFSTWHGDPVCSVHLWYLADGERRDGARALRPR